VFELLHDMERGIGERRVISIPSIQFILMTK
jgi:hypothetical protein